jgi:hypothetical protein
LGLTGIAINKGETVATNEGERDFHYNFEIDNMNQVTNVKNILIVPLIDSTNKFNGVI